MTELTKEQSEKADYLLEIICNSDGALGSEIATGIFDSKSESEFVFSLFKKFNLINIIKETEGDSFYMFMWTENTCHFLKSEGGFTKKYKNSKNDELEIELSKSKESKKFKMNKDTIHSLEELKNGKSFILTKDSPNEISELIINLKNLGILHKPTRFGYACDLSQRKYLTKLIEIKSWDKFLDWSENENNKPDFINDFSGSTIGQVNQSSKKIDLKSPITQKTVHKTEKKSSKKSWIEIVSWIIGIIVGGITIYEFIIKKLID